MRRWFLALLFSVPLFAFQTSEKLFECTKIFEERKGELILELERIDEQKQSLDALKSATDDLLGKKAERVTEREAEVESKLQQVIEKESRIEKMLEENNKVLEEIKAVKMDKIARTYSKMKPAASAKILADMETAEASKILASLKPATTGKILAKMSSDKAAKITRFLTQEQK